MAGILCGPNGATGQGGVSQVANANLTGNTVAVSGPSVTQIASATQASILYTAATTAGVLSASTNNSFIYPYTRCVSAGGLVNGQTVVDVVFPNGFNDPQSCFAVVYTIAGGLLT